jgi:hypothetical protein
MPEIMALLMQLLKSYVLTSDMLCSACSNGVTAWAFSVRFVSHSQEKRKKK